MSTLPAGTVTFLFTDIEGSTRMLQALGDRYTSLLERHHLLLRESVTAEGGAVVGTEGDSIFAVFPSAPRSVAAAVAAQRALAAEQWPGDMPLRVRMGLHTGEGTPSGSSYVGIDVHRAARIAAAGHGGQVLLSAPTAALVEHLLPDGVTLLDLGEHRLKDLERSERLNRLLIEGLPVDDRQVRSLDVIPNNLPVQNSSFLGREREIAEVRELLGQARLLTLTGPGGTGKTRLSLQVAADALDRFPDGVYFVALAPIGDAELVAPTIAQEIGIANRGGLEPLDRLREHLRERTMLLVLDNFEQVASAAPVVGELLTSAARLTVLVTSRAVLHLYGEREYPVPPLGLPDPLRDRNVEAISQYEAVRLFIERAVAVKPDFRVTNENAPAVAQIAVSLDGLPLAIELAAARIRVLTPDAMLQRLAHRLSLLSGGARDLPERQQTLRGAIGWSHDMLDDAERRLFAGMSVFVGGAGLEAVESVCATDDGGEDLLDVLSSLVDKSLVRQVTDARGQPRFGMLETIRDFALEQLERSGDATDLRRRHARLFAGLVETARPQLLGAQKREWLDRLEDEHDNLRAAISWAVDNDEPELALRMTAGLWRMWQMRGYLVEGFEQVRRALAMAGAEHETVLRADALEALGGLAWWKGELGPAREAYDACLALRRAQGDRRATAEAIYNLSFTFAFSGSDADYVRGEELTNEARALFEEIGDKAGVAKVMWAFANLGWTTNQLSAARDAGLQALPIFRELDDEFMVGWTLYDLGVVAVKLRTLDEARLHLSEALEIFAAARDVSGYVLVLDAVAALAEAQGDRQRAARLSGAVAALETSSGTGLNPTNRDLLGFQPDRLRHDPVTAAAWVRGSRMSTDEAIAEARGALHPGAGRSRRGKTTSA